MLVPETAKFRDMADFELQKLLSGPALISPLALPPGVEVFFALGAPLVLIPTLTGSVEKGSLSDWLVLICQALTSH